MISRLLACNRESTWSAVAVLRPSRDISWNREESLVQNGGFGRFLKRVNNPTTAPDGGLDTAGEWNGPEERRAGSLTPEVQQARARGARHGPEACQAESLTYAGQQARGCGTRNGLPTAVWFPRE